MIRSQHDQAVDHELFGLGERHIDDEGRLSKREPFHTHQHQSGARGEGQAPQRCGKLMPD